MKSSTSQSTSPPATSSSTPIQTSTLPDSLQLESLKSQYNLAIIEYENAYQNFIYLANNQSNQLKPISNSKLIGTPMSSQRGPLVRSRTFLTPPISLALCKKNCNNNISCGGLYYIKQGNNITCNYYSKNTPTSWSVINSINKTSYIKQINPVINQLTSINQKINDIVLQINILIKDMISVTEEDKTNKQEEVDELNYKYNLLEQKNKDIRNLIDTTDNLTNEYNITSNMINKIRLTYFLWVLILIIILIFSIKYVFYS
jgi:hypothetical protein